MTTDDDARWLAAAVCLAERARPLSRPNPPVGAIVVRDDVVVGRGWTQPGGRPHAEAVALVQAGNAARGATLYVTLEPCAHRSDRGPACAEIVTEAGLKRVVAGIEDPDRRTAGQGLARLRAAGIEAICAGDCRSAASLAGHVLSKTSGFPEITLKLAVTSDGFVARTDGTSKWITGDIARAHVHRERARADAILVGRGTFDADAPRLDVRLPGLEDRSPVRLLLTRGQAPAGWTAIAEPRQVAGRGWQYLFVEGGARTAEAFLSAGLVHRILLYRAPTAFGDGLPAFRDPDPAGLPVGWHLADRRQLGSDTLEVYYPDSNERARTI